MCLLWNNIWFYQIFLSFFGCNFQFLKRSKTSIYSIPEVIIYLNSIPSTRVSTKLTEQKSETFKQGLHSTANSDGSIEFIENCIKE